MSRSRWLGQLVQFAMVSGVGLGIDVAVFLLLVHLGSGPFVANVFSASLAVTWVYVVSVRRIFRYAGTSLRSRFAAYAAYQVVGIAAASWAVGGLIQVTGITPLLAKAAVTPLTLLANFLFMAWLTRTETEP